MSEFDRIPTEHWSLHKSADQYELLAQIRPTDAYDGVVMFNLGQRISETLTGIVVSDGRIPVSPVRLCTVWLESSWVLDDDGTLIVEKVRVDSREHADDVMIYARVDLQPTSGR